MDKKTKIWLLIASFLVLAGCIIVGYVMHVLNWDFTKLAGKYETNRHEVSEDFQNISIRSDTADISLVLSPDGKCAVECYEKENLTHRVSVENDTLVIEFSDTRKWYEYIGIHYRSPEITVYLSEDQYASLFIKESTGSIEIPKDLAFTNVDISVSTGDVKFYASASEMIKINATTGRLQMENVSAGAINLSASTGAITLSHVTCQGDAAIHVTTGKTTLTEVSCANLTSTGSTGDISLTDVVAGEKMYIERSTGDIKFLDCDAAEICAEASTGDITGSLLTEKVFVVHSDTGSIHVPQTLTGGKCELTTDTGDIKISITS